MDEAVIMSSRHIQSANGHGVSKMHRNILALQQNLKNLGGAVFDVKFDRSRRFWEMLRWGPHVNLFIFVGCPGAIAGPPLPDAEGCGSK
jgi:hypothetical protein